MFTYILQKLRPFDLEIPLEEDGLNTNKTREKRQVKGGLGIQHPAYPHLVAAPCPTGYFPCNTSDVCVEQRMNCDSNADCPDSSDEWSCGKSLPVSIQLITSRQKIRTFYK
ncbi:RNase H domain-containing protein [Trichonephila inaurata madagascariensis]|uniref:RNase H domain-containing protein n=1 Tax=Trichonephila inaurata madagascariensis TaxID=2747483 RepID=A0A8X7BQ73_9ARAC|nr:RNase H domain-containing protein [Trichonephila inaurata madagascariensis]